MKNILLLFIMAGATAVYSQSKSYDYAYTNKKGICVYSVADKMEAFVIKDGTDPCISSDGKKLAYTVNAKDGTRFIRVIDLNTKAKTTLNTNNNNCYGAIWSPDGKWIAYNVEIDNKWTIAVIDVNNTGPKVLGGKINDCYSPVWLTNSKGIVVQNMAKVFVLDLSGNIIISYNLKDLEGGMPELKDGVGESSSDKFIITNDNKKIVFSCEVNDPSIASKDGPPSAVFIYDIDNKKTSRLSPKGYVAGEVIIKGNNVLFAASKGNSPISNIYSVDMYGRNFKLLFPGCVDISAKN
jgi:Tol biopolymer transport system component